MSALFDIKHGSRRNKDDAKLEALRAKVAESRKSPLIEVFDPERFLAEVRAKANLNLGSEQKPG